MADTSVKGYGPVLIGALFLSFVIYSLASMYVLIMEGNDILDGFTVNLAMRLVVPITISVLAWIVFVYLYKGSKRDGSTTKVQVYAIGALATVWTLYFIGTVFCFITSVGFT